MEILLTLVVGTLCIVCFFIGAKVGQQASKGEPIETPVLNPVKAFREHQEQKALKSEHSRLETVMRNIEKYDGTELGQEEVPRG